MFSKPSEFAGGTYFKPAEHSNDLAILVEPKTVQHDVPNTYNGVSRARDEVTADLTFFANEESLSNATPSSVVKNAKVVHGMLTSSLEKILGGAMVATVQKVPTQKGQGWAFRDVANEVEAQVGVYYKAREDSINEALADAPSFDD